MLARADSGLSETWKSKIDSLSAEIARTEGEAEQLKRVFEHDYTRRLNTLRAFLRAEPPLRRNAALAVRAQRVLDELSDTLSALCGHAAGLERVANSNDEEIYSAAADASLREHALQSLLNVNIEAVYTIRNSERDKRWEELNDAETIKSGDIKTLFTQINEVQIPSVVVNAFSPTLTRPAFELLSGTQGIHSVDIVSTDVVRVCIECGQYSTRRYSDIDALANLCQDSCGISPEQPRCFTRFLPLSSTSPTLHDSNDTTGQIASQELTNAARRTTGLHYALVCRVLARKVHATQHNPREDNGIRLRRHLQQCGWCDVVHANPTREFYIAEPDIVFPETLLVYTVHRIKSRRKGQSRHDTSNDSITSVTDAMSALDTSGSGLDTERNEQESAEDDELTHNFQFDWRTPDVGLTAVREEREFIAQQRKNVEVDLYSYGKTVTDKATVEISQFTDEIRTRLLQSRADLLLMLEDATARRSAAKQRTLSLQARLSVLNQLPVMSRREELARRSRERYNLQNSSSAAAQQS